MLLGEVFAGSVEQVAPTTSCGTATTLTTERSTTERLDPAHFLRIHHSFIIRTDYIAEFKSWAHGEYLFRMANGQQCSYNASIQ